MYGYGHSVLNGCRSIISSLGVCRGREGYRRAKNRNVVSCATVRGGPPVSATRVFLRRSASRCRAITSGPLRKLSNLAARRASSRSSSGGNNFLRARLSAKISSRSLSFLSCLRPYLEGQGHWSDLWISSIRALRVLAFCAIAYGVWCLARFRQANFNLLSRNSVASFGSTTKPYSSGGNLPRRTFVPLALFGRKNSATCEAALRRSAGAAAISCATANRRSVAKPAFAAIAPLLLGAVLLLAS
jgi:hypothetical protein